jgi:hypothetical protein
MQVVRSVSCAALAPPQARAAPRRAIAAAAAAPTARVECSGSVACAAAWLGAGRATTRAVVALRAARPARPRAARAAAAAASSADADEGDAFANAPIGVRLIIACSKDRDEGLEEARALLDAGASASAAVAAGREETWSPLMAAAQSDSPAVLALLVKRGADVNARTPGGWKLECPVESHAYSTVSMDVTTPLLTAVLAGAEAAVRALLALGADPRERHLDEYWDWQKSWELIELATLHARSREEADASPIAAVLRSALATVRNTPLRATPAPDPLLGNDMSWEKLFPGMPRAPPRNPPGDGGFGAAWHNGMGADVDAVREAARAKAAAVALAKAAAEATAA